MTNYKEIAKNWLNDPATAATITEKGLDSSHIDNLIEDLSHTKEDILEASYRLYEEVIAQYVDQSNDLMAMLVIGFEKSTDLVGQPLEYLKQKHVSLAPPPEIYLVKRTPTLEPYIVEEYKLPIKQDVINAPHGYIYAYFRTLKNEYDDEYCSGFYFEHYPKNEQN